MDEILTRDCGNWLYLMRRSCTRLCSAANNVLAGVGMNMPQFNALSVLKERGEVTMSALSKELGVTMGAGTNLMDRLVDAGYAERRRNSTDRRVVKVVLTAKGTEVLDKCTAALSDYWCGILDKVEPGSRTTFLDTYRKVFELSDKSGNGKVKRCPGV